MLSITKIFEFHSSHQLPNHQGKCKNVHGHSYRLEIEIAGTITNYLQDVPEIPENLPMEGMIMDFGDVKKLVETYILDIFDHKHINDILHVVPTAENMVIFIKRDLEMVLPSTVRLVRVRLWETSTSFAEWKKG